MELAWRIPSHGSDETLGDLNNHYESLATDIVRLSERERELQNTKQELLNEQSKTLEFGNGVLQLRKVADEIAHEMVELNAHLQNNDAEIVALKTQLESLNTEHSKLIEEKKEVDSCALSAVEQLFRIEIEMQKLKKSIADLEQESVQLAERTKDLQDTKDALGREKIRTNELEGEVSQLRQTEDQLTRDITLLKSQMQKKDRDIFDLKSLLESLEMQHMQIVDEKIEADSHALSAVEESFRIEVEMKKLKNNIEKLEQESANLQDVVQKKDELLEATYKKVHDLTILLKEKENEYFLREEKILKAESQISALKQKIADLEKQMSASLSREAELKKAKEQESASYKAQIDLLQLQVEESNKDNNDKVLLLQAKLSGLEQVSASYQEQIATHKVQSEKEILHYQSTIASLQQELRSLEQVSASYEDQIAMHKVQSAKENFRYQSTIASLQEELEQQQDKLVVEQAISEEKIKGLYEKIAIYQQKISELQTEIAECNSKLVEAEETSRNEILKLQSSLSEEQAVSRATRLELEAAKAKVLEQKDEILGYKNQNKDLLKIVDLHERSLHRQREESEMKETSLRAENVLKVQELSNKIDELNLRLTQGQAENEQLKRNFEEREKQLESYCSFINQEKAKQQKIIQELARQIHHAVTLHPLRDYLFVTEKELSRVEGELKKTPIISPHRSQLEKLVDQLIEQRDVIRDVLAKGEKNLSSHTEALDRLSRGGLSVAAPPPPLSKNISGCVSNR
ncbi:MAG: hypothetical protein ACM3MG_12850 [Bacillota bacterium]